MIHKFVTFDNVMALLNTDITNPFYELFKDGNCVIYAKHLPYDPRTESHADFKNLDNIESFKA